MMYCIDCYGLNVVLGIFVIFDIGKLWGLYGLINDFILKGIWDKELCLFIVSLLCLKCYNLISFSGFLGGGRGNLYVYYFDKVFGLECMWCYVVVLYGWKNCFLLVNLNDVGEEVGYVVGLSFEVLINGNSDYYIKEFYYFEFKLKVYSFGSSGLWVEGNCGLCSKVVGSWINLINGNFINNINLVIGKDWMRNICNLLL